MAQKQEKHALPRDLHQSRLLSLLSDGKAYSIADISIALKLSDPRSVIRNLRRKGYIIGDEWHKAIYGIRYKRYFIKKL